MKALVTGATGYIGGRLVPELLAAGHDVRVMVRDIAGAESRPWASEVEIVEGDLLDLEATTCALEGVEAAYYLIHSMAAGRRFGDLDRRAALNFVRAGQDLSQVIYLGGIDPDCDGGPSSRHLNSRIEVGRILREGLPTTELRAGPVIGGGSASFEMVRYLTERLPAMIAPRWILNEVRPVAVRDVLAYLVASLGRLDSLGVMDIGSEPLTFKRMMQRYAEARGLPRAIVPVPVLAPKLAALWVGFVTPIPNSLAVPLVEGVVHPIIGDTSRARRLFPEIAPLSYGEAVRRAIARTDAGEVVTRWSAAAGDSDSSARLADREGVVREVRTKLVDASPDTVFRTFSSLGGAKGWLVWNWAWAVRGLIDQLVGGPGLRRGRRDPVELYPGEALDFWRVEEVRPGALLRLRAEMRVPGKAWLQFEAIPDGRRTRLVQTAFFAPTGFMGWLYWYGIYPLHKRIFSDLVGALAEEARRAEDGGGEVRGEGNAAAAWGEGRGAEVGVPSRV